MKKTSTSISTIWDEQTLTTISTIRDKETLTKIPTIGDVFKGCQDNFLNYDSNTRNSLTISIYIWQITFIESSRP